MKNITKPDAIFFDWDDTIFCNSFYTSEAIKKLVKRHLTRVNASMFPTDPEISLLENIHKKIEKMAGIVLSDIIVAIFNGDTQYFVEQFRKQYSFAKEKHGMKFLEGGIRTLKTIQKMGIPMALISNKRGDFIRSEVKTAKLDHLFFTIIGDKDFAENKPSPMQILEAIKIFEREHGSKIDPKKCFMIGDASTDIMAAKNAGCTPIHIGDSSHLPQALQDECKSGKVMSVKNHRELQNIINTIKQTSGKKDSTKAIATKAKAGSGVIKRAVNK
jgi:beta-phosphoglucomutase-like phosphatase (HAD superfamily)